MKKFGVTIVIAILLTFMSSISLAELLPNIISEEMHLTIENVPSDFISLELLYSKGVNPEQIFTSTEKNVYGYYHISEDKIVLLWDNSDIVYNYSENGEVISAKYDDKDVIILDDSVKIPQFNINVAYDNNRYIVNEYDDDKEIALYKKYVTTYGFEGVSQLDNDEEIKNALVNYKGYDGEVYMASNHAFYYDINGKMFSVTEMVPIQEIDDYELKSSNLSLTLKNLGKEYHNLVVRFYYEDMYRDVSVGSNTIYPFHGENVSYISRTIDYQTQKMITEDYYSYKKDVFMIVLCLVFLFLIYIISKKIVERVKK